MKNLVLGNRRKLVGLSLIVIFSAVAYLVMRFKNPDCDVEKISFHGVDMRFPQSVSAAKSYHSLIYNSAGDLQGVLNDIPIEFVGSISYFKVMYPLSWNERYVDALPESSILNRQINGYAFYVVLHGDSLRRKLESDFGGKFELKENRPAIKSGSKWNTCYEMKINKCLYVTTSNFGHGRSINWITFMYGLDEAERADFDH